MQGAVRSFSQLCEAVTSWRQIQCEGLRNEIVQLLQLYKQNLEPVSPVVRGSTLALCSMRHEHRLSCRWGSGRGCCWPCSLRCATSLK